MLIATSYESTLGDLGRATAEYEALIQRFPNFTIARFHLGVIYARNGDKQRAKQEFERVLTKNPGAAAARFHLSG